MKINTIIKNRKVGKPFNASIQNLLTVLINLSIFNCLFIRTARVNARYNVVYEGIHISVFGLSFSE